MLFLRSLASLIHTVPLAAPADRAYLVVRIADGDVLTARCGAPGDYQQVKVRLTEIDAPEKALSFGKRSRQSLAAMCAGATALLRRTATDRYGRTVARLSCRGMDANAEQVRTGMAWAYAQYQSDPAIPGHERAHGRRWHGRRTGGAVGPVQGEESEAAMTSPANANGP